MSIYCIVVLLLIFFVFSNNVGKESKKAANKAAKAKKVKSAVILCCNKGCKRDDSTSSPCNFCKGKSHLAGYDEDTSYSYSCALKQRDEMLEPPPLHNDPQEPCTNCGVLTTGVCQCLTCQKFICLICYSTDTYYDELRAHLFCQSCTEVMSDEGNEEEVTQLVSDNDDKEEEEQLVSDNDDKEEEEYAPTDEDNSSEEERGSRGDRKKGDEVGSEAEHEFDDTIGMIAFMFHFIYGCL